MSELFVNNVRFVPKRSIPDRANWRARSKDAAIAQTIDAILTAAGHDPESRALALAWLTEQEFIIISKEANQ
jgi:hypothetical protein